MAGQIIKRGESTWLVRVFLGRDAQTGKRQYHNHTVHGAKKDAQAYLHSALNDLSKGIFAEHSKVTVDTLLDALLSDYRVNSKAYGWAELNVRLHLRPAFGNERPAKVTTEAIRKYIDKRLETGAAPATVNRSLALLRRAFSLGLKSTPPLVNRVPFIPMLAENNVRKGFFEDAAFLAVRSAIEPEIKLVVSFAYFTGCRKGEILGLEWPQVDLLERVVRLNPGETKNDESRVIPLVDELFAMLSMQKRIRDEQFPGCPWVFSRYGERIRSFRRAWERACKLAGLVDADGEATALFHDLRRTGVRNLVRAGVPESVAMRISGHRTRAIFERYNITSEQDLKNAAAKLGSYIQAKRAESAEFGTLGGTQMPSTTKVQ